MTKAKPYVPDTKDYLAEEIHRHWLGDPVKENGEVSAVCTCGDVIVMPKWAEHPDPVFVFSEHVANKLREAFYIEV